MEQGRVVRNEHGQEGALCVHSVCSIYIRLLVLRQPQFPLYKGKWSGRVSVKVGTSYMDPRVLCLAKEGKVHF